MAFLTPQKVRHQAPPAIFRCTICIPKNGVSLRFGLSRSTMHLQSDVRHHDEIVAARIGKGVMLPSAVEELQTPAADLAFAVIVDPDKCLYTGRSDTASDRSSANNDPHPPST